MDPNPVDPHHDPEEKAPLTIGERRARFGARLMALREAYQLSLVAMAQETRIGLDFLQALESGDLDRLPGDVFGRGFIRVICKSVRATAKEREELIEEFDCCWDSAKSSHQVIKDHAKVQSERRKVAKAAAKRQVSTATLLMSALIAVTLALAGLYIYGQQQGWFERLEMALRQSRASSTASVAAKVLDSQPTLETEGGDMRTPTVVVPAQKTEDKPAAVVAKPDQAAVPAASDDVTTAASLANGEEKPKAIAASSALFEQVIEMVVSDPVRVRLVLDDGGSNVKELAPDTYRFTFQEAADMLVYDAGAVKISFNGRSLGPLGSKGRVRRLSFAAKPASNKKL